MESKAERRQSILGTSKQGGDGRKRWFIQAFICLRPFVWPSRFGDAGRGANAGGTANLSGGKVKVGVLTDIAGPTAKANGKGSVIAAEMAAEDFGAGLNVEVISADHSAVSPISDLKSLPAGSTSKVST